MCLRREWLKIGASNAPKHQVTDEMKARLWANRRRASHAARQRLAWAVVTTRASMLDCLASSVHELLQLAVTERTRRDASTTGLGGGVGDAPAPEGIAVAHHYIARRSVMAREGIETDSRPLRVLQEGEIDPVGAKAPLRVDVRIISATNRSLAEAVAAGRFREDLYYRLNAVEICMPALRERRAEIRGLAAQILARLRDVETRSPVSGIDDEALALLEAYDWPGNIRQLENTLHRAVVLSENETLGLGDFAHVEALMAVGALHSEPSDRASERALVRTLAPAPNGHMMSASGPVAARHDERMVGLRPGQAGEQNGDPVGEPEFPLRDSEGEVRRMVDVEADLIRLAVLQYDGRMSEIARRLGIGRSTLYRKMREYKIEDRS